jgi:hypothetical protein
MGNTYTGKALCRPIIKQIHAQHIEKRIQGHFQFMKLTKDKWNNGNTHTGKFLQGTTHSYK